MKVLINRILCAQLYFLVVTLSPMKLLVKFDSVKQKMIKYGYLRMTKNGMDLSLYNYSTGQGLSMILFYGKAICWAGGMLPFWMTICKVVLISLGHNVVILVSLLLSFGLPLLIMERCVIRNDCWEVHWKEFFKMSQSERRPWMIVSNLLPLVFLALLCLVWVFCLPHVSHLE